MLDDPIFKNLSDSQKSDIEFLINSFMADNVISDKERALLKKRATELGIDIRQFDDYINNRLQQSIDKEDGKRKVERDLFELVDVFLENDEFTDEQRNYLICKAQEQNIDPIKFNERIDQKLNEQNRLKHLSETSTNSRIIHKEVEQKIPENNNDKSRKVKPAAIIVPIIIIGACVFFLLYIFKTPKERPIPLNIYVEHNPSFVFQTASMSKYLVLGTPNGTWDKWEKLQVFQVKATADFSFDMTKLEVKREDLTKKELTLSYVSDTFFPLSVDIDIPQGGIIEVEKIDPEKITIEEAEAVAKTVSLVAGPAGAWVGGKVGSSIGKIWGKTGQWIGGGIGVISGGGLAGYKAYIWTRDKICGMQLSPSISVSQSEEFITTSKAIMAAEMLDLNLTDKSDLEKLRNKYEDKIEDQVQYLGQRLGWAKIFIEFKYNN